MDISTFDFGAGKVTYWDLDFLDVEIPSTMQLEDLKEDLALIDYRDGNVIDIGWYPEFSPDGWFIINVINNDDWNNPVIQIKSRNARLLYEAVDFARSVIEGP